MKRILAATLAAALASSSTVALAQTPPVAQSQAPSCVAVCQAALGQASLQQALLCAVPIDPKGRGPVAVLSEVDGQILQAAARGFTPVAKQSRLSVGDQVVLAEGSQARLASGPSCQAQLTGPAVVDITPVNNCGCITQAEVMVLAADLPLPPPAPPAPEIFAPVEDPPGLLIAAGALPAIGLILALLKKKDRPSRVVIPVTP